MIPKHSWFPYLFLLGILTMLSIVFYEETIAYFPSHIHAWTQSDRYAIALKFLQNGFNLFKPQTFNLQTLDGITAVDLPLSEWFVAVWMKVLGSKAPVIFRLHTLLISFVGYFFLFETVKHLSQSTEKGIIIVIFVFICPVITYYQAGFIPSSLSLSLFFCGCFFIVKYWEKERKGDLILAITLLSISAFVRKPFIIFLFALFICQISQSFRNRLFNRFELSIFGIAFLSFIGLQIYNIYLTQVYGSMFLGELMPARSFSELSEIISKVYHAWKWQYFTIFHYIIFLLILAASIIFYLRGKKVKPLFWRIFQYACISLAGGATYFLLMARQFLHHEYYFIDSFYVGFFLLFLGILSYIPVAKSFTYWGGVVLITLLLIGAVFQSNEIQKEKYSVKNRGEVTRMNFTGSDKWLNDQGIAKDARILVLDAYSTNAPLILMNRDGYTVLITRDSTIQQALAYEYDYIAIQDEFIPSEVITPSPQVINQLERIAGNGKISLFRYEEMNLAGTLEKLLGIKPQNIRFSDTLDFFTDSLSNWDIKVGVLNVDSTNEREEYIGMMSREETFGPTFAKQLPIFNFDRLLFRAEINKISQPCDGKIVVSIQRGEDLVYYKDYPIELYHEGWQDVQFMFKLPAYIPENSVLKCYLWNPNRCDWQMDNLMITAYEN